MRATTFIPLILIHCKCLSAFVLPRGFSVSRSTQTQKPLYNIKEDAIDVEFTRNDNGDIDGGGTSSSSSSSSPPSPSSEKPQSPLQVSLSMIPPHLRIPVEFTDPISKSFIPCQVAFVLEQEGIEFSIGTPVHAQVSIVCEDDGEGKNFFVDPDLDENLELMEMAAAKFEELNEVNDLIFARTPRTLTVQGDLDALTDGWKIEEERPLKGEVNNILDDVVGTDADDEFFDSFFRKELGENYRKEVLVENEELDKRVEDMMDLFTVPGYGTEKDDVEGIEGLLDDIEIDRKKIRDDPDAATKKAQEEGALRLVGFEGPDGRPYSLVKMLQPLILVAKKDDRLAPDQRILLSKEEANQIIPILEKDFKNELVESGLTSN